jgi:hypothetical protein
MVFRFAPSWWGNKATGNADLTQTFSSKQLEKLTGRIFFVNPSFGGKFEFSAFSPT